MRSVEILGILFLFPNLIGGACLYSLYCFTIFSTKCSLYISGYYLYNSLICLNACPDGYTADASNSCQLTSSQVLININFGQYSNWKVSTVGNLQSYNSLPLDTSSQLTPIPTKYQGFYFASKSSMKSTQSWVFSPDLTITFWSLLVSANGGILIQGNTVSGACFNNNLVQIYPSASNNNWYISVSPIYEFTAFCTTVTYNHFASTFQWELLSFTITQVDCCTINIISTQNGVAYTDTVSNTQITYSTSLTWYLGTYGGSPASPLVFLYQLLIKNSASASLASIGSLPACAFNYYWNGAACQACGASCSTWPWCVSSACSACDSSCNTCSYTCSGFATSMCACISGEPVGSCCNLGCSCCSTFWGCSTCGAGYNLIGSICLSYCPTGSCTTLSSTAITDIVFGTFGGSYAGFVSGSSSATYYPFNSPEPDDPIPIYNRGLYFDTTRFLNNPSILLAYNFTIGIWVLPTSGNILSKGTGLKLSSTGVVNINLLDKTETANLITTSSTTISGWSYLTVTVSFSSTSTTIKTTINNVSYYSNTLLNMIFKDTTSAGLVIGNGYVGFVYGIKIWNYAINSFSNEFNNYICGVGLGSSCLNTCSYNQYYSSGCQPCLASCTAGCVRSSSCNVCPSDSCSLCTSFTVCTACSGNSYLSGSSCVDCGTTSYVSGTSCIPCPLNSYVSGGSCVTCSSNSYVSGTSCVDCGTTSYVSGTSCIPCPSNSYVSGGSCVTCSSNSYVSGSSCVNCGTTSYVSGTSCIPCPSNSYVSGGSCITCSSNSYVSGSSCVDCGTTSYVSGNSCIPCPSNSYVSGGSCITCSSNSYVSGSSCVDCGTTAYVSGSSCVACPSNSYVSGGSCVTCSSNSYVSGSNCVDCGTTAYVSGTSCIPCPSNSYVSGGSCITCSSNSYVSGSSCVNCGTTSYVSGNSCIPCPSNSYVSGSSCITCSSNSYVSGSSCVDCGTTSYVSGNSCIPCPSNSYVSGGSCITCSSNSYVSGSSCAACPSNSYVSGSSCVTCPSTSYVSGSSCVTCPFNSYGSGSSCVNCGTNSYVSGTSCIPCGPGFYLSGISCASCYTGCKTCSGPNINNCLSCLSGYFLWNNLLCLTLCPSGYTPTYSSYNCTYNTNLGLKLVLDTLNIGNNGAVVYGADSQNYYPEFDSNDPWPAYDRGYYFTNGSYIASQLVVAPTFSINLWLKVQKQGIVLSKNSRLVLSISSNSICP
jgi:hypothetical protein